MYNEKMKKFMEETPKDTLYFGVGVEGTNAP